MNIGAVLKAFDTAMALRDALGRVRGTAARPRGEPQPDALTQSPAGGTQPIEARLTGVVVAALKEAFDRDHARLELERQQLEQQQRRAEEMLKVELRRQSADRELIRLRLLAGTALVAWLVSMVAIATGGGFASTPFARGIVGAGWILLLASFAAAFTAQERVSTSATDGAIPARAASPLWLLVAGLALIAASSLFLQP